MRLRARSAGHADGSWAAGTGACRSGAGSGAASWGSGLRCVGGCELGPDWGSERRRLGGPAEMRMCSWRGPTQRAPGPTQRAAGESRDLTQSETEAS